MDDRLKELHNSSGFRAKSVFSERVSVEESLLGLVMGKNNDLRAYLDDLEQSTSNIDRMTKQVIIATSAKAEHELSARILEVSAGAKMKISQTKDVLDFLRAEQKQLPKGSSPADMQMLGNIINSNSIRFKSLLQDYLRSQENYKVEVQRKTHRQLRIAYPGATEESLQQLASNPKSAREAVQKQRQTGGAHNIDAVLDSIEDKYKSLTELEANVSDLHDLFLCLGVLVDNQQDVIDSVEASVWNTNEYVTKGHKELLSAKDNQSKYETKKIILYFCLALVVLCIAGYVAHALGLFGGTTVQPVILQQPRAMYSFDETDNLGTCECSDGQKGMLTSTGCDCSERPHRHYHLKGSNRQHQIMQDHE